MLTSPKHGAVRYKKHRQSAFVVSHRCYFRFPYLHLPLHKGQRSLPLIPQLILLYIIFFYLSITVLNFSDDLTPFLHKKAEHRKMLRLISYVFIQYLVYFLYKKCGRKGLCYVSAYAEFKGFAESFP